MAHLLERNLEENGWDAETIADMRGWLMDCEWADVEADDIEAMPAAKIHAAVDRHFAGGVRGFVAAMDR